MVTEAEKIKIIDFIENASIKNIKYSNVRMNGPLRVTIIKHLKTGGFLPKIGRRSEPFFKFVKDSLINKNVPDKFRARIEDDPNICLMDIEVENSEEAWELCYWLVDHYRETEKILLDSNSNFFFKDLPLALRDIIDGAVAGDAGIYQRAKESAIFYLTLGIKQLGHLEEFRDEIQKFGYRGDIKKYKGFDKINNREYEACTLTWTLRCLLLHRKRWYGENGQKRLPKDLRNTAVFWRWFYAGDGCLYILTNHSYRVLISSNDFLTEDVDRLIDMLREHNIKATKYLKRIGKINKLPQWVLTINKRRDVDSFLSLVSPPIKGLENKWKVPNIVRECICCHKKFSSNRNNSKYCSFKCQRKTVDARAYLKKKQLK